MQIKVYVFIFYIIIESFDLLNLWCNSHLTIKKKASTMEKEVERRGKVVQGYGKGGKGETEK